MAGYSGTPLVKKLGFKPGFRVAFPGAPGDFLPTLGDLPDDVSIRPRHEGEGPLDLVVLFVTSRADLTPTFSATSSELTPAGMLWVAWPKKASGVATDLDENVIREIGLAAGLVDVKVCAIDDVWSGLKFVTRVKDRPTSRASR
jgi:hypothetical protein